VIRRKRRYMKKAWTSVLMESVSMDRLTRMYVSSLPLLRSEKAMRFRHLDYNADRTEKLISCPCPDICLDATFHANSCTRFWVISLTDRQTNEHGRKHVPAPLSEIIRRSVAAGFGRHGMLLSACNDTGIAFCYPNEEEAEMRRTYESDDP